MHIHRSQKPTGWRTYLEMPVRFDALFSYSDGDHQRVQPACNSCQLLLPAPNEMLFTLLSKCP
eukprot:2929598-Amphidinium_carterae.1